MATPITLAQEVDLPEVGGQDALIWAVVAVLVLILIILLIALAVRGRSRPESSREDLIERAARAEAERDALRTENDRLREENDRLRGTPTTTRSDEG